jgi:hypothetical protein
MFVPAATGSRIFRKTRPATDAVPAVACNDDRTAPVRKSDATEPGLIRTVHGVGLCGAKAMIASPVAARGSVQEAPIRLKTSGGPR